MKSRLSYATTSPEGITGIREIGRYLATTSLEESLQELIKLRASQINGCAFCIDMHWKDARAIGESEQRLYGVSAWHESPYYTNRERAALAWTEAITLISENHVPDELYAATLDHFSEKEIVDLTLAVIQINAWNRLAIAFRNPEPGVYESRRRPSQRAEANASAGTGQAPVPASDARPKSDV